MTVLRLMFSRRWLVMTLIAVLAAGITARLGFWQLDRLEQRQAFNARVLAAQAMPVLEMNGQEADEDLYAQEYRPVLVRGEYDFAHQVALINQVSGNRVGVHLFTPLRLVGTEAWVVVNRGWAPMADFEAGLLAQYDEPGLVTVSGILRRSDPRPDFGSMANPTPAPGQPLKYWYLADLALLQANFTGKLFTSAYIQQTPAADHTGLPERSQEVVEVSEGPHMGYALQWFAFAAIALIGYPLLVWQDVRRPAAGLS